MFGGGAGMSGLDRPMCGGTCDDNEDECENKCFGEAAAAAGQFPGLEKDLSGVPPRCDNGDRDIWPEFKKRYDKAD